LDIYAWYTIISRGAARLFSFALGILIFLRKPNRMTWVTSIYLIVGIESGIGAALSIAQPAWLVPFQILSIIGELSLVLFALLFPIDRFAPHWTRWFILPWALISIAGIFISHNTALGRSFGVINLLFLLLLVGIVIYRYRQVFSLADRQKVKWVIYAFAIGFGLFVSGIAVTISVYGFESPVMSPGAWILQDFLIVGVGNFLIPAAIAISILRYQLFDIDVIIRKTLLYGSLTALLVVLYFGLVTLLQGIFFSISHQQSPISIVLSTLAIAALFNLLRMRLQNFIDRRFYRGKYDAEQAMAKFAQTARSEVAIERLSIELLETVKHTLQPEKVNLWLNPALQKKNINSQGQDAR
jgi:hypothetical protein